MSCTGEVLLDRVLVNVRRHPHAGMVPIQQDGGLPGCLPEHEAKQVRTHRVGKDHPVAGPAMGQGFIKEMPGFKLPARRL